MGKSINLKPILEKLKKLAFLFWQRTVLILVFFVLIDLIIAGLIFFVYYHSRQEALIEVEAPPALKINDVFIETFVSAQELRKSAFENALDKVYLDPFIGIFYE